MGLAFYYYCRHVVFINLHLNVIAATTSNKMMPCHVFKWVLYPYGCRDPEPNDVRKSKMDNIEVNFINAMRGK
jgi:hypothetical protein